MENKKEMTEEEAAAGLGVLFGDGPEEKALKAERTEFRSSFVKLTKAELVDRAVNMGVDLNAMYGLEKKLETTIAMHEETMRRQVTHIESLLQQRSDLERSAKTWEQKAALIDRENDQLRDSKLRLQGAEKSLLEENARVARDNTKSHQRLERAYKVIHDLTE